MHNAEGKQNHSGKVSDLEIPARWGSQRGFLSIFLLVWGEKKRFFVALYRRCCRDWARGGRSSGRPPAPARLAIGCCDNIEFWRFKCEGSEQLWGNVLKGHLWSGLELVGGRFLLFGGEASFSWTVMSPNPLAKVKEVGLSFLGFNLLRMITQVALRVCG